MTMDPWTKEFQFQISLAESIWKSTLLGKERIAFILLDNIIEFMCKTYLKVARGLVGKSKLHKITLNDWDDISRHFDNLIASMKQHSQITGSVLDSIEMYHQVRNDLYHTSMPMAVTPEQFKDELKNAIAVFEILYQLAYSSSIIDVESQLHGKPSLDEIVTVVGDGQSIRINHGGDWPLAQWIRVAIYGHVALLGNTPSMQKIQHTLAISNQPTRELKVRQCLHKLRHDKDVEKLADGTYSLTKNGAETVKRNR